MDLEELIRTIARFLSDNEIDHFVFGAVGMNFWIPPRFTNDLDVALCIKKPRLGGLVERLNRLGFKITAGLKRKLGEGRIVRLPIGETRLDLKLCWGRHDDEALRRAREFLQDDLKLMVATAEDIVLYKLQSWRDQDQVDIRKIVAEYGPLDRGHIEGWLGRIEGDTGHPVEERWGEVSG